MTKRTLLLLLLTPLLIIACTVIDRQIPVVSNFQANAYLGTWYEIARLDHGFERGLTHVQASYREEGDALLVLNQGYDPQAQKWQSANGIAYFIDGRDKGLLRVSFFRPFYGAYQIHALLPSQPQDGQYQNAIIMGPNNSYLWLLSRQRQVNDNVKQTFIEQAAALGVNPQQLIWVPQTPELTPAE